MSPCPGYFVHLSPDYGVAIDAGRSLDRNVTLPELLRRRPKVPNCMRPQRRICNIPQEKGESTKSRMNHTFDRDVTTVTSPSGCGKCFEGRTLPIGKAVRSFFQKKSNAPVIHRPPDGAIFWVEPLSRSRSVWR